MKRPRLKGASPAMVPVMTACPDCGLELEAGKGKHRLAWHGCQGGPTSLDMVEHDVLVEMRRAAKEADEKGLIALLEAVRDHRKATKGGGSVEMEDWLTRREG